MPRYIDADEILKDKVSNAYISRFEIDLAPTADVQEVKHGKWKDFPDGLLQYCSICGRVNNCRVRYALYCHNCGARMDGDDDA